MNRYRVKWEVVEVVNGTGEHDDGVRDGDRRVIARGEVERGGESADALRGLLTVALEGAFPPHATGPTYDLVRSYGIEVNKV